MANDAMVRGYATSAPKGPLVPIQFDLPSLGAEDVEIAVTHCGICRSDVHLVDGDWPSSKFPLVPGHEIVGTVVAAGPDASYRRGERLGVGWQARSCMECDRCLAGRENLCTRQQATCLGQTGGFAARVQVSSRFAVPIPPTLQSAEAAPLLCAGVTVFAPLSRSDLQPGAPIAILGIGGLGHLAVRFARAMGFAVTAFTSSEGKRSEAIRLGATEVAVSTSVRDLRAHAGRFEFVLSTVPVRLDWITILSMLKPGGTLCLVGASPGLVPIPVGQLVTGQRTVSGSDIGSPAELRATLEFASRHGIIADVEVAPMREVNEALQRVRENRARYRVVLTADDIPDK